MKESQGSAALSTEAPRVTTARTLLLCGIFSSVLYVTGEIAASLWWEGYSYVNQAVSELAAVGALTRPFMLTMFSAYNLLVIAFAVGVWMAAGTKRALRISASMLVVYVVVGEITQVFSPMNPRGSVMASNDIGHILLTAVEVLSIVLFIAFGSVARGRGFRIYSIASILVIMAAGITTGALSQSMTAAASSTPWAGAIERVNIYGTMLWIAMLAVVLLRTQRENAAVAADVAAGAVRATKKVAVLMGSPQKHGATYTASRKFLDNLEAFGDVTGEIVALSDYDIRTCRGCKTCFAHGEERCPLKDDRDILIGKMRDADAVVFASPNYSWHVSGVMKVFLDRLGFAFHRPQFHGKTSTAIVVQGIMRGGQIRKYLEFSAGALGFTIVKGSVSRTLKPMTEKAVQKMDKTLARQALRFHDQLLRPARPVPSLFALMMFRMGRTGIGIGAAKDERDYAFYRERGWFESDFYYPTHLGLFKRAAGAFFDWLGAHIPVFQVADETDARSLRSPTRPAA
jgi:multimeric flavodoxin WrbA